MSLNLKLLGNTSLFTDFFNSLKLEYPNCSQNLLIADLDVKHSSVISEILILEILYRFFKIYSAKTYSILADFPEFIIEDKEFNSPRSFIFICDSPYIITSIELLSIAVLFYIILIISYIITQPRSNIVFDD